MNLYKKLYDDLIQYRLDHPITKSDCYCETHHIIPHKLGGNNDKSNLINLLPDEHFKAHVYLCQYYKSINDLESYTKMLPVPILMTGNKRYGLSELILNLDYFAKLYSELRNDYSRICSNKKHNIGKRKIHNNLMNKNEFINKDESLPSGYSEGWLYSEEYKKLRSKIITKNNKENHPRTGKCIIYNLKTFEVKQISKNSEIPNGWEKGFKMNNSNRSIWIHNPNTLETKMIGENDEMPSGFIKGRGKFTEEQKKNYKGRIPWNKGIKISKDKND